MIVNVMKFETVPLSVQLRSWEGRGIVEARWALKKGSGTGDNGRARTREMRPDGGQG